MTADIDAEVAFGGRDPARPREELCCRQVLSCYESMHGSFEGRGQQVDLMSGLGAAFALALIDMHALLSHQGLSETGLRSMIPGAAMCGLV